MKVYTTLWLAFLLTTFHTGWAAEPGGFETHNKYGEEPEIFAGSRNGESDTEKNLRLGGFLQFWWTMLEGAENDFRQPFSGNTPARESSGFSIRRARLSVEFERSNLLGRASLSLEGSTVTLRDAYVRFPLAGPRVELWGGQMKVPSTYEIGDAGSRLDFITRSLFSTNIVDYSLITSPDPASPLSSAGMGNRDLGLALKGTISRGRYFVMVGNGFGANRFFGGREKEQDVFRNGLGRFLYAARVSFDTHPGGLGEESQPVLSLRAGGHASWNNHPNIVLTEDSTVLDIKRFTWSADLRADFDDILEFTVMYGEGFVKDDFDGDGKTDYQFRGWELKLLSRVLYDVLRFGFRYDAMAGERDESGVEDILHSYTFGATYEKNSFRLQWNYKRKVLESDAEPDLDDDVVALSAQIRF